MHVIYSQESFFLNQRCLGVHLSLSASFRTRLPERTKQKIFLLCFFSEGLMQVSDLEKIDFFFLCVNLGLIFFFLMEVTDNPLFLIYWKILVFRVRHWTLKYMIFLREVDKGYTSLFLGREQSESKETKREMYRWLQCWTFPS